MAIKSLLLAGIVCAAGLCCAQRVLSFDVATVKRSDPNEVRGRLAIESDRFVTVNQTLNDVLQFAYALDSTERRIFGQPDWADSAKFDINAKMDGATAEQLKSMQPADAIAQVRRMVQGLLAEKFALKLHHETRELPVYKLRLAKSGAKLRPSLEAAKPENRGITSTGGHVEGRQAKVSMLAELLGHQMETGGRKVLDETGLTGEYDFSLRWTRPESDGTLPADAQLPGLFTALQEQLGFRLELTKAPVDVLVIDHAEIPKEE